MFIKQLSAYNFNIHTLNTPVMILHYSKKLEKPPLKWLIKKQGWYYLRPFCWVSLTAKKWMASKLVRGEETQQKISGCSTQPTNKPWPMLEPNLKIARRLK
jgi:hypothetical protein